MRKPNPKPEGLPEVQVGGPWQAEQWVDEGPVREAADAAVRRGGGRRRSSERRAEAALDLDVSRLRRQVGAARADRVVRRLADAGDAYADERFDDARRLLRSLLDSVPDEPAVHELYGLTLYRLGRWRQAAKELAEFAERTSSTEQHPVLADCHRALGHHDRVEELWQELAGASIDAAIVAEGRIVLAGSLADRGRVVDAIRLVEAAPLGSGHLKDHHLRLRYVLADLYERAGDRQQARRLFESVTGSDPGFADVRERLRSLR